MSMSLFAHSDHATVPNAACDSERRRLPRALRLSPYYPSLPLFVCNQSFLFCFRCVAVCVFRCARALFARVPIRRLPSAALQLSPQPPTLGRNDSPQTTNTTIAQDQRQATSTNTADTGDTATKGNSSRNKLDQRSVTGTAAETETEGHWGSEQRKGKNELSPKPPFRSARFNMPSRALA